MYDDDSWVYLNVQVIRRETELAFQVILDDGPFHWIPKSQCHPESQELKAGDRNVTLAVTEWIAQQKGLV